MNRWFPVALFLFGFACLKAAPQPRPYFQQHVKYTIRVTLNAKEKTYSGDEILQYKNNSPDTLTYIWMHLYPNAYKNESTPFARQLKDFNNFNFHFSKDTDRGYLKLTSLQSAGRELNYSFKKDAIDEIKIGLPAPLPPGDSLTLRMSFTGRFPVVFSRMGHFGDNYFAVTQWYPKVVVYDRYGWHPDSYLNQGEFYGEYGDFDVHITVPERFVVDATGRLQDNPAEERFMQAIIDSTQQLLQIKDKGARQEFIRRWKENKKRTLNYEKTKTLRYVAHNVHNFAWFCGLDYMLLRKTHHNGVLTNVLVTPENACDWRQVPGYVVKTIDFYSTRVGPYQYPKASVVDGSMAAGGGMEYPMITIISTSGGDWSNLLEMTVMHEVGHNWFMGMLGSDERACTFLDEGLNSFLEYKYMLHYHGFNNLTNFKKLTRGRRLFEDIGEWQLIQLIYGRQVSRRSDQPMDLPAAEYSPFNYGAVNYQKGVALLLALEWYLTPDVFWKGMHEYFKRWNGKHPDVGDFFTVMSNVSGQNLEWFVNDWFKSTRFNDFTISKVKTQKIHGVYRTEVYVRNKGTMKDMPAPVYLVTTSGDTLQQRWNGQERQAVVFKHTQPAQLLEVNLQRLIFESNYLNNRPGLPRLRLQFLPQFPRYDVYSFTLLPYYWYEPFVDKHRPGVLFWSGNPINKQWLAVGLAYYGTESAAVGYGFGLTNRFHFPWANYSDVKAEILDRDGLKRKSLSFDNVFLKRDAWHHQFRLKLDFDWIDLYNDAYYDVHSFSKARYAALGLTLKHSFKSMLLRWNSRLLAEKGFPQSGTNPHYTKLELESTFKYLYSRSGYVRLRAFAGGIWGSGMPVQETFFAGGDADAKHKQFVFQRRGKLAPLRYVSRENGLAMFGYRDAGNPFYNGRFGASLAADVQAVDFLPVWYGAAAVLADNTADLNREHLFAESGLKINLAGLKLLLPLYISDPPPGENHLAWRFLVAFNIKIKIGY